MSTTNISDSTLAGQTASYTASDLRLTPTYWSHMPAHAAANTVPRETRQRLLEQYGDFTMAYSVAHQPQLEYFGDERGLIAFRRRRGITFALGDPLCAQGDLSDLLARFVAAHRRPSFVQVSRHTATALQSLGFWVNEMGVDTWLDLPSYTFNGKDKEWLRYADNTTRRRGYRVEEFQLSEWEEAVAIISEAWRATRRIKRKEVRFLNRPIVMRDEPGVRRFGFFNPQGELEAFISFDPLYRAGQIVGYTSCIKRRSPASHKYSEQATMKQAIARFQEEGVPRLWLGLSPLAKIEDREFRANRWLSRWCRYYFRAGWINNYFYHLIGHADYKRRFCGQEQKVYYASPVRFNGFRLLTLASLCGIF